MPSYNGVPSPQAHGASTPSTPRPSSLPPPTPHSCGETLYPQLSTFNPLPSHLNHKPPTPTRNNHKPPTPTRNNHTTITPQPQPETAVWRGACGRAQHSPFRAALTIRPLPSSRLPRCSPNRLPRSLTAPPHTACVAVATPNRFRSKRHQLKKYHLKFKARIWP